MIDEVTPREVRRATPLAARQGVRGQRLRVAGTAARMATVAAFAGVFAMAATGACAEEASPSTPAFADVPLPAAPAVVDGDDDVLDKTRDAVRDGTVWLARKIDSWFGDRPFEAGGRVTDGRLEIRTTWRRDEGFDAALRFGARFELPNLRDRAFVFIGRDVERDVVTDRPEGVSKDQLLTATARDEEAFFAGLGTALGERVTFRAGVRGGLKLFTQVRFATAWALSDRDRLAFRETLFWTSADGLGSTTSLSLERLITPALTARWLSSGTVSQESEGFEWWSNLGLYRSFGRDRLLSTELLVEGETASDVDASDYGLRVRWLQPVHEDWLLGEFSIGHFWPREDAASERERTWALGFALKMRF